MRKTFTKIISEKNDHYINMLSTIIYLVRGEVDSSILPAAPAKSATNKPFWLLAKGASIAFRYGTEREDEISIRGKSVEFVRVVFCANSDRWGNGQQKKRRIQTTRTSGIFTK